MNIRDVIVIYFLMSYPDFRNNSIHVVFINYVIQTWYKFRLSDRGKVISVHVAGVMVYLPCLSSFHSINTWIARNPYGVLHVKIKQ